MPDNIYDVVDRRAETVSRWLMVFINLAAGLLCFFGVWSVIELLLVYLFEIVLSAFFALLKLIILASCAMKDRESRSAKLFLKAPAVALIWGTILMILVPAAALMCFAVMGEGATQHSVNRMNLLQMLWNVRYAMFSMLMFYVYQFFIDYIGGRKYRYSGPWDFEVLGNALFKGILPYMLIVLIAITSIQVSEASFIGSTRHSFYAYLAIRTMLEFFISRPHKEAPDEENANDS